MEKRRVEILCTECGAEALLLRNTVYDGFEAVGEKLSCSACGYEYDTEEDVEFRNVTSVPNVFSDSDRSEKIDVFQDDERGHLCRYCQHYVVNPFMQWCALHRKEVDATDDCPDFVLPEPKSELEVEPEPKLEPDLTI